MAATPESQRTFNLGRARALGLTPEATQEIVAVLTEVGDEVGRDYASVFARVAAGQSLLEALELPPQTVDILYAQAFARFNARRVPEAMHLFQSLTLLAPNVKDHWLGLGICLRMVDQYDAARTALDVAHTLAPDCPAVLFHRTELACQQHDWARAAADVARFQALPETPLRQRLLPEFDRYAALVRSRR
jgi:tetratricopeptide (TPR) repeat protein